MPDIAKSTAAGNILLVDGDPAVREAVCRALTVHGYTVFEARDGHEAFLLGEGLARPLHLLVTDVILDAWLNGFDLARHLQVMRPGLPVLYMGSIPADEAARRDLESGLGAFLSKPFDGERLRSKVDSLARTSRRAYSGEPGGRVEGFQAMTGEFPAPRQSPLSGMRQTVRFPVPSRDRNSPPRLPPA